MSGDISDIVDKLPLKRNATTSQIIFLGLAILLIATAGWATKGYFDADHAETLAAIGEIGKKTESQDALIAANTEKIEWVRRSWMSKVEMAKWARELDKQNRGLNVPDVPDPLPLK